MGNNQVHPKPFHQSDIETYLVCPRQYYFRKVLNFKPEYRSIQEVNGTVIHKCIEMIHQENFRVNTDSKLKELYSSLFTEEEEKSEIPLWWNDREKEFDKLVFDATSILHGYANDKLNQECELILSEANFRVKIGRYPFEGRVDQLRRTKDGKTVLMDFKSGNTKPNPFYLRLSNQFSIYAYACKHGEFLINGKWEKLNILPDEIIWCHLRNFIPYKRNGKKSNGEKYKMGDLKGDVFLSTQRTEHDLEYLEKDIARICGSIRLKQFYRRVSMTGSCNGFCRFNDICFDEKTKIPLCSPTEGQRFVDKVMTSLNNFADINEEKKILLKNGEEIE